jgi:serine/threonine protein kinase
MDPYARYYRDPLYLKYPYVKTDRYKERFETYYGKRFDRALKSLEREVEDFVLEGEEENIMSNLTDKQRDNVFKKYTTSLEYARSLYLKNPSLYYDQMWPLFVQKFMAKYGLVGCYNNPTAEFEYIDSKYKDLSGKELIYEFVYDSRYKDHNKECLITLIKSYVEHRQIVKPVYLEEWENHVARCSELVPIGQVPIGEGTFAKTYLVASHGTEYALKITKYLSPIEVDATCRLRHPNLIKCVNLYMRNDQCDIGENGDKGMLLEYCENTLLSLYGNSHKTRVKAAYKICSVVDFIHSKGLLHLDIKPANVMVCGRDPSLIDFGSSVYVNDIYRGFKSPKSRTSIFYRPPEHFGVDEVINNNKTDVWSLGMLLLGLLSNEPGTYESQLEQFGNDYLYEGIIFFKLEDVIDFIHKNFSNRQRRYKYLLDYTDDPTLSDLLAGMLDPEPTSRMDMKEVILHDYFYDEKFTAGHEATLPSSGTYPVNKTLYKYLLELMRAIDSIGDDEVTAKMYFEACSLYNRISRHIARQGFLVKINYTYACMQLVLACYGVDFTKYSYDPVENKVKYEKSTFNNQDHRDNIIEIVQGSLLHCPLYEALQTKAQVSATYKMILMNPTVNIEQVDIKEWLSILDQKLEDDGENKNFRLIEF